MFQTECKTLTILISMKVLDSRKTYASKFLGLLYLQANGIHRQSFSFPYPKLPLISAYKHKNPNLPDPLTWWHRHWPDPSCCQPRIHPRNSPCPRRSLDPPCSGMPILLKHTNFDFFLSNFIRNEKNIVIFSARSSYHFPVELLV